MQRKNHALNNYWPLVLLGCLVADLVVKAIKEFADKYRASASSRSLEFFRRFKKMKHLTRSQIKKLGFAGLTALCFTAAQAFAAVDPAVTTAINTMATDAATVASAVLVAIIGVVAIKFIRKGL